MTTPNFTVKRYGTDTSGRDIFLTAFMHQWWEGVVKELGFRPTIVQGAFMVRDGGGATDSAGYHDAGGCMDVRVWDLTAAQQGKLVRTVRRRGGAGWIRDEQHGGMDSHFHITLGGDQPLSPGAKVSWASYLAGGDGLAGGGRDYHWRPDPLVTVPVLPGPNAVQRGRRLIWQGLRQLRLAKGRPAVDQARKTIHDSVQKMPKK